MTDSANGDDAITETEIAEMVEQISSACDASKLEKAQHAVQDLGLNPGEMIHIGAFAAAFGLAQLPPDDRMRRVAMAATGGIVAQTHDAIAKMMAEAKAAPADGGAGFGVLVGEAYVIRADGTVEH